MHDLTALSAGLARALARISLGPPQGLERLSGGANMESWRFSASSTDGSTDCVLRRSPGGEALLGGRSLTLAEEAAVIRAARAGGLQAPEVLLELAPDDGIGPGFVMRAIAGTPDPAQILATNDPDGLLDQFAQALAATHRVNLQTLTELATLEPAQGVAALRDRFLDYGGDRPIIALGLRWLAANLPAHVKSCLVHGDFRMGNMLVEDGRLTGVLDWELAHLGDGHEDLAYGCMAVWRFTRPDREAYGLGSIARLAESYEAAGGEAFDPLRFRFWLVYRTLWWALGCLQMGQTWRSGLDRSLERVVVARRCAEQELDLLLLLEGDAPAQERRQSLPPPAEPLVAGLGEPNGAEVLTAISEWLADEIKPLVSGRGRFNLAVARNALGIVAREIELRPDTHDAALASQLLKGELDLTSPGLLARLRRSALAKLSADMPKYPSLAAARSAWES